MVNIKNNSEEDNRPDNWLEGGERALCDMRGFFHEKVLNVLDSLSVMTVGDLSCELIEGLGFPQLPEMFESYNDRNINFEMFLLFHYLDDTNFFGTKRVSRDEMFSFVENFDYEDFDIRKFKSVVEGGEERLSTNELPDFIKDFDYENFSIEQFKLGLEGGGNRDVYDETNFSILNNIKIPEEWVVSFMFKVGNIKGRKYLFEHYIDENFEGFKGYDKLDYDKNHIDRFIGEFSKQGPEAVLDAFRIIEEHSETFKEKELIFHIGLNLLGEHENIDGVLEEAISIFESLKNEMNIIYFSNSEIKTIKKNIVLTKLYGEKLTKENLIKNQKLYTFVPNLLFTKYGEDHELIKFLTNASKKYRPKAVNTIDGWRFKYQRTIKNTQIGMSKWERYTPDVNYIEDLIEFCKKKFDVIISPEIAERIIKMYDESVDIDLTEEGVQEIGYQLYEKKILFEVFTQEFRQEASNMIQYHWLMFSEYLDEKHQNAGEKTMKKILKRHKKKNKEELAFISNEELVDLYNSFYTLDKVIKTLEAGFEMDDEGIKKPESGILWGRNVYYLEREIKKRGLKATLKFGPLVKFLKIFGRTIKAKAIYGLLFSLAFARAKTFIMNTDFGKRFMTDGDKHVLNISPEHYNFLIRNKDRIADISQGFDDIENAKNIQKHIDELSDFIEELKAKALQIEEAGSDDDVELDKGEMIRAFEIMAEEGRLKDLEEDRREVFLDYARGNIGSKKNEFLIRTGIFIEEEQKRTHTSMNEYNTLKKNEARK